MEALREEVSQVKVGPYSNRQNRVGPITDRSDLKRLQAWLVENADWLDPSAEGVIRTMSSIVEPAIILKPLRHGGNFSEYFAPMFFVQEYESDAELADYFENPRYALNAMYVTIFGHSPYIESLSGRHFSGGRILHDASTIIRNTDLHAPGIERGTQPYGGFGRGASCISLNGRIVPMPSCPQRDIYEFLVVPAIKRESRDTGIITADS